MIRIVSLTEAGQKLAIKLADHIDDSECWYKPQPFTETIQQAFVKGDRLIMICATGIVIRTLGPVLNNKQDDPAVLVLDELGQFVIPLLSGHEGGANQWGDEIASWLKAQLVQTTAKPYLKPVYTIGMGCERNCPKNVLSELLFQCLDQAGLTIQDISSINSIDIKADEIGLIELSNELNISYQTWNTLELGSMESLLSTQSEYIYKTVGVYGVAESAALFGAQSITDDGPELVLNKQKNTKATCAIARSFPLPAASNYQPDMNDNKREIL